MKSLADQEADHPIRGALVSVGSSTEIHTSYPSVCMTYFSKIDTTMSL